MASSFAFPCFYDTESHGFGRGRLPRSASAPRNGRPEHQRRPTPMWKLESFKAFLEEKTHSLRPSASPASRSSGICTTRPSDFEWRCRGWLVPGPANDVVPQGRGWHLPCSRSHGSGSGGHRSIEHPSRGKQQQRQKKKKTRKKKLMYQAPMYPLGLQARGVVEARVGSGCIIASLLPARGPTKLREQGNHMWYVPFPDLCSPDPSANRLSRPGTWPGPVAGALADIPSWPLPGLHVSHSGKKGGETATGTTMEHDGAAEEDPNASYAVRCSRVLGSIRRSGRVSGRCGLAQDASATRSAERRGRQAKLLSFNPHGVATPMPSRACWLANRRFRAWRFS